MHIFSNYEGAIFGEERSGEKGQGRERGRRGTNLVILGIFDGLWSVPDEQLECLQIVHHGCPV